MTRVCGTGHLADGSGRADGGEGVPAYRHRFGLRVLRVDGQHFRVDDHEVHRRLLTGRRRRGAEQDNDGTASSRLGSALASLFVRFVKAPLGWLTRCAHFARRPLGRRTGRRMGLEDMPARRRAQDAVAAMRSWRATSSKKGSLPASSGRLGMPVGSFRLPKTAGMTKRQEEEEAPSSCHGRSRGGHQTASPAVRSDRA